MSIDHQQTVPDILKQLARLLGTNINNNELTIPEKFGKGSCAGYVFNPHIRMIILNYELREDLIIDNPENNAAANRILFKFQQVIPEANRANDTEKQSKHISSVMIATSRIHTNALTIHTHMATINIEVEADYLKELFDLSNDSPVLQSLLLNTQPLLFEQMIYPSMQRIIDEMIKEPVDEPFKLFFLRVKAEELICRLLMELVKRDEKQLYDLNSQDVQIIYKVKARMLEHLEQPPVINELALDANMSPTKLKRLFKQIFGNSIFNYYQTYRMQEAARLLKEEKLSVSEAGYQLGFTNLSHFSRVFYEHTGMKPKQYSRS